MDSSTGWACVSHASDVLGVCTMITSALLRTETERWREMCYLSSSEVLSAGFLGRLGITPMRPLTAHCLFACKAACMNIFCSLAYLHRLHQSRLSRALFLLTLD